MAPASAKDLPPCTCLTRRVLGGFYAVVVLDPYCHIPQHKEAADYGAEPEYPRNERPDSQAA